RMVDAFVWAHPDMTILFAAGNCLSACSSGTIGTPATAKDIVTVGGAYNPDTGSGLAQNDLASQSGRGPTVDGRIKPTIVTIFDGESAMSDGNLLSGRGQPDDKWFGTSYSTPAAAAAAAIIRQYFTDGWYPSGRPLAADAMTPSAALIRALLIASGVPVTGSGTVSRSPSDTWDEVIGKPALAGDCTVRVIGSHIPVGPQPFARVATGGVGPSDGRVRFGRPAYSEGDTVRITVEDSSATSVVVHVPSGIESAGENVTIVGGGPEEVWRGSIQTAFGTPAADGVLQVREGDTLTATYQDAGPPHTS